MLARGACLAGYGASADAYHLTAPRPDGTGLEAALRQGWIPASAGFEHQDEEIPITPVREKTSIQGSFAVSTSLAFGGNNAAIVIGRGSGV